MSAAVFGFVVGICLAIAGTSISQEPLKFIALCAVIVLAILWLVTPVSVV